MKLRDTFMALCVLATLGGCKHKVDRPEPVITFLPVPAASLPSLPPQKITGVYGWDENCVDRPSDSLSACLTSTNPLEDIIPAQGPADNLPDASVQCFDAGKNLLLVGHIRGFFPKVRRTELPVGIRQQARPEQAERYVRVGPEQIAHFRDRQVIASIGFGMNAVLQNYPTVSAATTAFPQVAGLTVRHWDTGKILLFKAPDGSFYAHACLTDPREQKPRGRAPKRPDSCATAGL